MNTIKLQRSFIESIINLLTLMLITFAITPFLRRNIPIIIVVILITLIISILFLTIIHKNIKISKFTLFIIMWISIIFLYRIIGFSTAHLGNYVNQMLFFLFMWLGSYYLNNMNSYYIGNILKVTLFISTLNILHNIYLLALYPNASVELNFSSLYYTTNIGGTTFSLFSLILFCSTIIIRNNKIYKISKLYIFIIQIICLIYIFQSSRAITIIFLCIYMILNIYIRLTKQRNIKEKLMIIIIIAIFIVVFYNSIELILNNIAAVINNERVASRIMSISNFIYNNSISIELGGRLELYKLSISTFFLSIKNFILGVGYHTSTNNSIDYLYKVGVGNHSELIDIAARYGIIGIFLVFNIFSTYIKGQIKICETSSKSMLKILWIVFLLYSIFNNSFDPSIGVIIFIIVPFCLIDIKNIKEENVAESN